jgi:hypothetical protein
MNVPLRQSFAVEIHCLVLDAWLNTMLGVKVYQFIYKLIHKKVFRIETGGSG